MVKSEPQGLAHTFNTKTLEHTNHVLYSTRSLLVHPHVRQAYAGRKDRLGIRVGCRPRSQNRVLPVRLPPSRGSHPGTVQSPVDIMCCPNQRVQNRLYEKTKHTPLWSTVPSAQWSPCFGTLSRCHGVFGHIPPSWLQEKYMLQQHPFHVKET